MSNSPTVLDFIKELYRIWITERPNILAAALAYFGMFSFAPAIFIAFTVAGFFVDELAVADQVFRQLENILGPDMAQYIQNTVYAVSQPATTGSSFLISAIGFVALLLAASGLFFQLQYALNVIWKVPPPTKDSTLAFLRQRLFSFVMVIGVGLLLVLATLAHIILAWFASTFPMVSSVPFLNTLLFLGLVTFAVALLYKVLPDVDVAWRDVWLGAGVTAVLVTLGGWLVGIYLTSSGYGSAFEAAGAIAVILIGIYFISQLFLFGSVFTRVYASMFGSKADREI